MERVGELSGAGLIVWHWLCVGCQLLGQPLLSGTVFAGNDVDATLL